MNRPDTSARHAVIMPLGRLAECRASVRRCAAMARQMLRVRWHNAPSPAEIAGNAHAPSPPFTASAARRPRLLRRVAAVHRE